MTASHSLSNIKVRDIERVVAVVVVPKGNIGCMVRGCVVTSDVQVEQRGSVRRNASPDIPISRVGVTTRYLQ